MLTVSVFADPSGSFDRAVAAYRAGEYQTAANLWNELIAEGYEDARIYFNLGNTCYRMNRFGPAILHYERALRLDPKNARARENLEYVRLRLKDRFQEGPRGGYTNLLRSLYNFMSVDGISILFLVLFLLLQAFWTVYLLRREPAIRTALTFVGSILLALLLLVTTWFGVKLYRLHVVEQGVVMAPSVTAKSAPRGDATDLFVVHEGTTMRLWESVGEWRRVSLPNGLSGFVPRDAFEAI